jgi:hypothetical protein
MDNDDSSERERELDKMEAECAILETVSQKYLSGSSEAAAIRRAAFALSFTVLRHGREFREFLEKIHQPLTPAEEDRIRRLNLDSSE